MDIDLGGKTVFRVSYDGKVYALREPTVNDIEMLQASTAGDEKSVKPFLDLVEKLGMPRDVANNLGITKLKKLADGITGEISGNESAS